MSQLSLSEVASLLNVSTKTIRRWESALPDFIQSSGNPKTGLFYPDESIKRLGSVAQLRDKGYSLETVREIFTAVFTEQVEVAASTSLEAVPEFSSHAMVAEFMEAFHQRFDIISKEHIDDLKKFMDDRLQSVSQAQSEILDILGTRKDKHRKKRWFGSLSKKK